MIIDGHAHFFNDKTFRGNIPKNFKMTESMKKMADSMNHTMEENRDAWLSAMNKENIEKTVFMSTSSLNDEFTSFINSSERFFGFATLNPELPEAVNILKKELENGMSGVKLYATNGQYNIGSNKTFPFYEYCENNQIPITIHCGVTIGPTADLFTGNPIHISRVLSAFPELKVIIAHFGAGYFREVLMLKYKRENLYIETSGTNNWLPFQDNFLTLKDVFKKSLEIFSPERIIFGTDTRIFPDGYRTSILNEQKRILDELNVSNNDKEKIMNNNMSKLLNNFKK
ncbi:MAG: amidohydrolase family protein [Candidatus Micrarchaeaceae archaeon]